jgi:thiamine kinase-like enzyme
MSMMIEMDINDVVRRLRELHAFSPALAQRNELERSFPENPALWFADEIERTLERCDGADYDETARAFKELERLLTQSYAYYVDRLAHAGMPWTLGFPGALRPCTHYPVYTQQ